MIREFDRTCVKAAKRKSACGPARRWLRYAASGGMERMCESCRLPFADDLEQAAVVLIWRGRVLDVGGGDEENRSREDQHSRAEEAGVHVDIAAGASGCGCIELRHGGSCQF